MFCIVISRPLARGAISRLFCDRFTGSEAIVIQHCRADKPDLGIDHTITGRIVIFKFLTGNFMDLLWYRSERDWKGNLRLVDEGHVTPLQGVVEYIFFEATAHSEPFERTSQRMT